MKVSVPYDGDSTKCRRYKYQQDGMIVMLYIPFKQAGKNYPQEFEVIVKGLVAKSSRDEE